MFYHRRSLNQTNGFNMKITSRYKIHIVAAVAMSGMLVVAPHFVAKETACQQVDTQSMTPCVQGEQQSWFSWIRGESRSTQFHFVDLLELLNRLSPAK